MSTILIPLAVFILICAACAFWLRRDGLRGEREFAEWKAGMDELTAARDLRVQRTVSARPLYTREEDEK